MVNLLILVSFLTIRIVDLRSSDFKMPVTLAFLGAFGSEQGLLTYFVDLSGPT